MNIEKTLLYTTAAIFAIAVYLDSPHESVSYLTSLMMISMAAKRRDDDEHDPKSPGQFLRSTKLSSLIRVVRKDPETSQVEWQEPRPAKLQNSQSPAKLQNPFMRPIPPTSGLRAVELKSSETETADLPSWVQPTSQKITEDPTVAAAVEPPPASNAKQPVVSHSVPQTSPKPAASPPMASGQMPATPSKATAGMRIKKSAAGLWREPAREAWIDEAISAKKANPKSHANKLDQLSVENSSTALAATPQQAHVQPAQSEKSVVLWRISEGETKSPNGQTVSDSDKEASEQRLTFKRAEEAALLANELKSGRRPPTSQCAMNIPAWGAQSTPSPVVSRPPQPYAIDWTQSSESNQQQELPKLKSLKSIIPPHQPKMDNPFDSGADRLSATAQTLENGPAIIKPFSSSVQANSLPMQTFQQPAFQSHTFAARTTAAQTLSLPAQTTETGDLNSKPNTAPVRPTGGAFSRPNGTDMTSTIPMDMEVQVYEEPLHPSTPKNPDATGFTKRGLPNSMVTTQQLKTLPAGNRRAEEYKKALKSNLALQRKCQILVERLVQERTAKLELLNHELQIARDKAIEMSKLKSQFVANISHELRTPLAGILGLSELLKEMDLQGEQSEVAEHIHNSAMTLMTTVSDLLDFSKLETGKLELTPSATSIREIVKRVIASVKPMADEKRITIYTHIDPTIPEPIFGDPERVEQVLSNFVRNAVKFTEHGSIRIEASVDDRNGDWVVVRFAVADTGIGICESDLKKLFSPFVQADGSHTRKYGGTGLGLSISKGLVSLMSGGIGVSSVEGQGSTFAFTIPFQMHMPNLCLMPLDKQRTEERAS